MDLGNGVRLSAARVDHGRLLQVRIERKKNVKGNVAYIFWAASAELTADERTHRLTIQMTDGDGRSGDGMNAVEFGTKGMEIDYTLPPEPSEESGGR